MQNDILVEISEENLPKLATLYEKHKTWAPHIVSLIHSGISWKRNEKYKQYFTFYSVEKTWETDGTIIILQTNFCYNISIFTLDETSTSLYRGLTETKILNYSAPNTVFFCIHENHVPIIKKAMEHLQLKTRASVYSLYTLRPKSIEYNFLKSEEIYFKKLDLECVLQINAVWSCKFKNSEKYINSLIELYGGVALFLKSTNEMVAWILRYSFGHVGLLQTGDGWTRRGFGSLVTKILLEEIVKEGHWPCATISPSNLPSLQLFKNLGFQKIADCAYLTLS